MPIIRRKQLFSVENLIISCSCKTSSSFSEKECDDIFNRWEDVVRLSRFRKENGELDEENFPQVKTPFYTMSVFQEEKEYILLSIKNKNSETFLFLIDEQRKVAKNYMDIEEASIILNDDFYDSIKEDITERRSYPSTFIKKDGTFTPFNISQFIGMLQSIVDNAKNEKEPSGMDCIEISLEQLGNIIENKTRKNAEIEDDELER